MSEIKPVYQKSKNDIEWLDIENGYEEDGQHNYRVLYPAAAYEALQRQNAELKEDLQFVERWANHHGTKPNVTAQEALSCIQHYPSIAAITKSYKDGVIPATRNPYAEIKSLEDQAEETLTAMRRAVLALAFAAEKSRAMQDDYQALSNAIAKAVASKNGE